MKIKTFNWILSSLVLLLSANMIFWACQKDPGTAATTPLKTPVLTGIKFEDGRLKFNSQADFERTIDVMREAGQKGIQNIEAQFAGFESSDAAYHKTIKEQGENLDPANLPAYITAVRMDEGDIYLRPSVDFKLMAHLSNTDGIYQIGSDVFKTTYYKWYRTSVENAALLSSGADLNNTPGVEAHDIIRQTEAVQDRSSFMSCSQMYNCSPCSRKFHGEVNNITGAYNEVRVDFDHYKRGAFGAWYHNDAPSMNFAGSVSIRCCTALCKDPQGNCPTLVFPASMSGSNESEIFDVLVNCCYGFCGGVCSAISPSSVTYNGLGDFNFNFSCTASK